MKDRLDEIVLLSVGTGVTLKVMKGKNLKKTLSWIKKVWRR
jgi:hypothetical protein